MKFFNALAASERETMLTRRQHKTRIGAVTVEYVMIVAVITVGIAAFFSPRPPNKDNRAAFDFYDTLRDTYRRAVVFVSVPLL